MRILLVNTSERTGGAAIAANRLMHALWHIGAEAKMLVRDRSTRATNVVSLPKSPMLRVRFVAERAQIFLENKLHKHRLFEVDTASFGTDITQLPEFKEADVVHLHWINQGFLSLSDIAKILRSGKPLVWTLHDMWPCTGICHYSQGCGRWMQGCGQCPILLKGSARDLSYRTYLKKQQTYAAGRIHFVACSDWLAQIAQQAPLLAGHPVESIPNAIDTHVYSPAEKLTARRHLGLPGDKTVLLFVAYKATDPIKGIKHFREALNHLQEQNPALIGNLHVVVVGREATSLRDSFPCPATTFEYVSDERTLRDLYNAANLLMMPTLQDNLPNTIVEAMACGLPCVGFRVGGLPQLIETGFNGYLAEPQQSTDFAKGIAYCLDTQRSEQMAQNARQRALRTFSEEAVANRYMQIYNSIVSNP